MQASELSYWLQDRAELSGSVEVTRGNQSLIASHATYNDERQSVSVDDGVLLREPGLLIEGRTAEMQIDTGAARVTDGGFVMLKHDLRGNGELLERSESGDFRVSDGSFTRCEPGNEEWKITSSSVQVDDNAKFGTARNAVLRVQGVPIFYTPYIRFPVTNERMSGWLFPDVGRSQTNGTDIAVPYYLNLAPNYDATVMVRSIAKRGVGIEGTARHLSRFGTADIGGSFLPEDNIYNGRLSRHDFDAAGLPGPFEPADRWLFTAQQLGYYGDLRTRIDSTKVSDFNYFRDFGSNLATSSQVEVQQFGEVVYARDGWTTGAWVQDFQRLDLDVIEPYRRLPELDLSYQSQLQGPISWSVDSSWASFRAFERASSSASIASTATGSTSSPASECRSIGAPRTRIWSAATAIRDTSSLTFQMGPTINQSGRSGSGPWTAVCSSSATSICSARRAFRHSSRGSTTSTSSIAISTSCRSSMSAISASRSTNCSARTDSPASIGSAMRTK